MAIELRQSTSIVVTLPAVISTSGAAITSHTGAAYKLSKMGGAFGVRSASGSPTIDAAGDFRLVLDTVDTSTTGELVIQVSGISGQAPYSIPAMVVSNTYYDAKYSTARFPANIQQVAGVTATASGGTINFPSVISSFAGGPVSSVTGDVGGNIVGNVQGNLAGVDPADLLRTGVSYTHTRTGGSSGVDIVTVSQT